MNVNEISANFAASASLKSDVSPTKSLKNHRQEFTQKYVIPRLDYVSKLYAEEAFDLKHQIMK